MRYTRQNKIDFLPDNFNEIIKDKKIVIVGCGGIGSPLAVLLVKGGFLNLTLIDNDKIEEINIQRQIYNDIDIEEFKVECLKKYLILANPYSNITIYNEYLNGLNISKMCNGSDLIIDASDNFETRRIINNFCEKNSKDWIYNGAIKTEIISCIFKGKDKKFEKVFPNSVEDKKCAEFGILGSTTFASASLAYNHVLKYFLYEENNKLIKIDLWKNKIYEIKY
ncbi:MAG: ThiF family adenylyltransferase [Candidatus Woesearchaeota archaeon]|jgi:molybdopterin/thiamine biosynthesis adenylyltransferase|nr:ThiF family adenylyltransferase [Candidatus Woesearchaeota archaeon]